MAREKYADLPLFTYWSTVRKDASRIPLKTLFCEECSKIDAEKIVGKVLCRNKTYKSSPKKEGHFLAEPISKPNRKGLWRIYFIAKSYEVYEEVA